MSAPEPESFSSAPECATSATGRRTARAAPDAPTWFDASSPWGPLRLRVCGASGGARHAVDAALVLQRCEALLDAFDAWSGLDTAWRWIETPATALSLATHAWVDWQPAGDASGDAGGDVDTAASPAAGRLELPWVLLRKLAPPPESLARQLHWPALPSALVIARLHLDAPELHALEPGGAVVLPESMRAPWPGLLRAAAEPCHADLGVALELNSACQPRPVERDARRARVDTRGEDNSIVCEVRLASGRAFHVDQLAGWSAGELGALGRCASLWFCPGGAAPARELASGRLMPWGDGWALALEAVGESLTMRVGQESTPIL